MTNPKYVVLEKPVGQTPLQTLKEHKKQHPNIARLPMAYAGRLDPMASGKLLVLVGDECKKQERYHGLDKEYRFEVLFGTSSDTGDVLGLIESGLPTEVSAKQLQKVASGLTGCVSLPYPKFSSRTVKGKPLHTWALENRLDEIEIPMAKTKVYKLKLEDLRHETAEAVYKEALEKIDSLPPVTEESKTLDRDFRRQEVRQSWRLWLEYHRQARVQIATFTCTASSGTYMRSLAEEIGLRLHTTALAYSIHRTEIGRYRPLWFGLGLWTKRY